VQELRLRRFDHESVRPQESVLLDVYREVYADKLTDPFNTVEEFSQRLHGYAARPGFSAVIGYVGGDAVGLAFGYLLPVDARWWRGLKSVVPDGFTTETGSRTFALNEIMVRAPWRRRGVARALHEELLRTCGAERATLLVEPGNPARAAYASWGYRTVGQLQPMIADAPVFEAMVRALGGTRVG
jgi:GNAT superfamily N-acetyltransferase